MKPGANKALPSISPLRGWQCAYFLLGLVLLWPGLVHGDLYGFNDTISYLRGADTVFTKIAGHGDAFFAARGGPAPQAEPAESMVLYGRSLYFGLFLYLGLLCGSFWVPVVLQAATAGFLVVAMVRHFVDPARERAFLLACLAAFALLACTPLPFFVCFLMPDLAVGLALPAAALLLVGWRRERVAWRAGLLTLAAFAALAHTSAVAVLGLLGAGALVFAVAKRSRATALTAAAVLAAASIGVAGDAVFGLATRMTTGADPVRPPFLTARLVEDGPGRRFLAERCGQPRFVLCRYPLQGRITAEVFLWDPARPAGGFKALPVADARQVSREQTRFAVSVLVAYPSETIGALMRDLARLVVNFRLDDFRPEFLASRMQADRQFESMPDTIPLPPIERAVSVLTAILALGALAVLACAARWRLAREMRGIALVVVVAIVVNDVICAWLSGPFARYGTRVIWLLPLVALLTVCAEWSKDRGAGA